MGIARRATTAVPPSPPPPHVAVCSAREPFRTAIRHALPRRRARLFAVRTAAELERLFHRELIDVVLLDISHAGDDTWRAAALAAEFPSAPFIAMTPYRGSDGPAIARCAAAGFADVLAEGVDDIMLRDVVLTHAFSTRFARALAEPPAPLGLATDLQQRTWGLLVGQGGRPVRTEAVARQVGMTREHLSRRFAAHDGANLKRIMDLVRVLAAAELSKNPGYDVADVATVLRFASSSHLATTADRVTGARPESLARLRTIDLVRRFVDGRSRSLG
jgi:AraC-like DNA-binding protein